MEEQTKKYLTYGAIAVGGLYLYSRWKASSHDKKEKDKPKIKSTPTATSSSLAPPSPANMPYAGSSYPGAGYAPYQPPYAPPYYPQQYPYPTPYLPGTPYIPPVTGYPNYPSYPPPYVPGAGLPPTVIGLGLAAARSMLQASGYYIIIHSINGRYQVTPPAPPNIPVAYLDIQGGLVRNAQYSTGQAVPYGGSYNTYAGSGPAY